MICFPDSVGPGNPTFMDSLGSATTEQPSWVGIGCLWLSQTRVAWWYQSWSPKAREPGVLLPKGRTGCPDSEREKARNSPFLHLIVPLGSLSDWKCHWKGSSSPPGPLTHVPASSWGTQSLKSKAKPSRFPSQQKDETQCLLEH